MCNSSIKQIFSLFISIVVFLSLPMKTSAQTNQNNTELEQQIMSAQQSAQAVGNQLAPNTNKQSNHHGNKMKGMQKMSAMSPPVAKPASTSTQNSASKTMGKMKNMGGIGMGKKKMMGRKMVNASNKATLVNLPAFPGYKHIYHSGANGFFLDKTSLITLSETQQQQLRVLQNSWQSTNQNFEKKINQAEQSLWLLTAEDRPNIAKIKSKIDQVSQLQAKQRLHFIQKVGEAATLLNEQQQKILAAQYTSSQPNN